jgi:Tol biopolymer transport system component
MRRMRRSLLLVVLLALIGGASLWWWHSRDRPIGFVVISLDDQPALLKAMATDGTGERVLVEGPEWRLDPAWSPDGQQLIYASRDIFVSQADGTGRRRLTDHATTGLLYFEPAWSPDGTQIAFAAALPAEDSKGLTSLYVMQADGSNVVRLMTGDHRVTTPSWSPDGRQLAFIMGGEDQRDIAIMRLADRSYQNITNTPDIYERRPRWSPDGQWIAFAALPKDLSRIYIAVIHPDGTEYHQLTYPNAYDNEPNWSPDGSEIVFVSDRDAVSSPPAGSRSFVPSLICEWISSLCGEDKPPDGNAIYVMNADGSNVRRLTDSEEIRWSPIWRPTSR